MKPFSKPLIIHAIVAAMIALGLLAEFKQVVPMLKEVAWGTGSLSEEILTPATTTYTRREFAEAIGRAVRGM